jgi:cation transport ATPase
MKMLLLVWMALPLGAELREVVLEIQPTDCVACSESLADRFRRVRGVERAEVAADLKTVKVALAAENRVRLSRLQDVVRQDGTKLLSTRVSGTGECARNEQGDWTLQAHAGDAAHRVEPWPSIAAGACQAREARLR